MIKMEKIKLFTFALVRLLTVFIFLASAVFISSGTLSYYNGWISIILILLPEIISGIVLFFVRPDALKMRLETKEKRSVQKRITMYSSFIVIFGVVAGGIDFRFSLTTIPPFLRIFSFCMIAVSYFFYYFAFIQNRFLHRTIVLSDNQRLVDSGIYGHIRHPMYLASSLLYFSISFILNSWITVCLYILLLPALCLRIADEERYLSESLPGYNSYKMRVRYRLIPYIW